MNLKVDNYTYNKVLLDFPKYTLAKCMLFLLSFSPLFFLMEYVTDEIALPLHD